MHVQLSTVPIQILILLLAMPCCCAAEAHNDPVEQLINAAREAARSHLVSKAITHYQKAVGLCPVNGQAWLEMADLQWQKGNFSEALYAYRKSAELLPDSPLIYHKIGLCLQKIGNDSDAIVQFQKAITLKPDLADSYLNLYQVLQKQGNEQEAVQLLHNGLEQIPDSACLHHALGLYWREQTQYEKSIAHLRKAVEKEPNNIPFMQDLAQCLSMTNCYDEALLLYQKIFEMDTSLIGALYDIGYLLKRQGHVDEGIQVLEKVIELAPNNAQAHLALGLGYLLRAASDADWIAGWKGYEWRWIANHSAAKQYNGKPWWDGTNLQGKRILVTAEQGLGDTFQFIRYAKILKKRGAYVIFVCPTALKQFIKSSCDYVDEVLGVGDALPEFDCQIPLMSLPRLLETTEKTIPADIPYLKADQQLINYWRERLSADKNIKIGICWQGNANYSTDALRAVVAAKSIPLQMFMTALSRVCNCSFYSLQKVNGTEQLKELHGITITDFGDELDGEHGRFMDTAALAVNLDLIITIDTSIAHLAAGLGVPTWILLPKPADWRWMMKRLDTPWYPNARLFRQQETGDWAGLLASVESALKEFVESKSAQAPVSKSSDQPEKKCATMQTNQLLDLPVADFLDQLTLLTLQNEADLQSKNLQSKEQEELLKRYRDTTAMHPEIKVLTQGLYAANCYLIAALKDLNADISIMTDIDAKIENIQCAQTLKKLLKNKIVRVVHDLLGKE